MRATLGTASAATGSRFWGPKAVAAGLVLGAVLVGGLVLLVRRKHDAPVVASVSVTEQPEASEGADFEGSGPELSEETPSEPLRPPAEPARQPAGVPMSAEAGLVRGRLPTPDAMRSGPHRVASTAVERGMEERASRAAILDRRLESHLSALKQSAQSADPASRQAIEQDIRVLESQLRARRVWETPSKVPRR